MLARLRAHDFNRKCFICFKKWQITHDILYLMLFLGYLLQGYLGSRCDLLFKLPSIHSDQFITQILDGNLYHINITVFITMNICDFLRSSNSSPSGSSGALLHLFSSSLRLRHGRLEHWPAGEVDARRRTENLRITVASCEWGDIRGISWDHNTVYIFLMCIYIYTHVFYICIVYNVIINIIIQYNIIC